MVFLVTIAHVIVDCLLSVSLVESSAVNAQLLGTVNVPIRSLNDLG